MMQSTTAVLPLALLLLAAGCSPGGDSGSQRGAAGLPSAGDGAGTAMGTPAAPVTLSYDVVGNAIVGQPVSVNLQLASSQGDRSVRIEFRPADADSVSFPEAQARTVDLVVPGGGATVAQQVTVIPRREGRIFLNVSATAATEQGSVIRSLSVPIQVGAAPEGALADGDPGQEAAAETAPPAEPGTR